MPKNGKFPFHFIEAAIDIMIFFSSLLAILLCIFIVYVFVLFLKIYF